MLNANISLILEYVKKLGFQAQFKNETNQICVVLKIDDYELPLFIRVDDNSDLVQLITFIPKNFKKGTEAELARILHFFNKEIDLPGFGLNEDTGHVIYRCVIPCVRRKFDEMILEAYINTSMSVCKTFILPILAVAEGKIGFEDLLKRAKEEGFQST